MHMKCISQENSIDIEINPLRDTRLNVRETHELRKPRHCIEMFSIILEKYYNTKQKHYNTNVFVLCCNIFLVFLKKLKFYKHITKFIP